MDLILNLPKAEKLCLPDETPKAKKQRLPDEMVAVSEKTEASEKSVEKGSAMTKVLMMDACFKRAMSHTDVCARIGDAIDAISHGENYARESTSHPCYNGDVFSLGCLPRARATK